METLHIADFFCAWPNSRSEIPKPPMEFDSYEPIIIPPVKKTKRRDICYDEDKYIRCASQYIDRVARPRYPFVDNDITREPNEIFTRDTIYYVQSNSTYVYDMATQSMKKARHLHGWPYLVIRDTFEISKYRVHAIARLIQSPLDVFFYGAMDRWLDTEYYRSTCADYSGDKIIDKIGMSRDRLDTPWNINIFATNLPVVVVRPEHMSKTLRFTVFED